MWAIVAAVLLVLAFVVSRKIGGSERFRFASYRPWFEACDGRYRIGHQPYRPRLEELEVRYCPTLITWWGTANGYWATAANWSTNTVPTDGDSVLFDGGQSNSDCYLNTSAVVQSVYVLNGYTGTIIFNAAGNSLQAVAGADFSNHTTTYQPVNIHFDDPSNTLWLGGTSHIDNGTISVGASTTGVGKVVVQGTLDVDTPIGGRFDSWANFEVQGTLGFINGGRLSLNVFNVVPDLYVDVGGTVDIANTGTVVIAGSSGGVLWNWGTINYTGTPNVTTRIDMPVFNGGSTILAGGGTLYIDTPNTVEGSSFLNAYWLQLSGGITLDVHQAGFYQTGGELFDVGYGTQDGISGGANGITIDGGNVTFAQPTRGNDFGNLLFTGNLYFLQGTLDVWINGSAGGAGNATLINDVGQVTINPTNTTLNVGVFGALSLNLQWNIISASNDINPCCGFANTTNPSQRIVGTNYQLFS